MCAANVLQHSKRGMYEGKHIHYSELDHKPLCSYSPKLCKQRRLNGYAFCIRHVLEDRSAPFRQCEYVAKYNSQRCTNPIPKAEDRRYCNSHLQVMGVLPKKERKKRHDSLESLALNITVPSLALKTPNGLDHLPPSPPPSLPSLLSLDPFGLCGGVGVAQTETLLQKKPSQGRQNPNPKQKPVREAEPVRPSPLPPTPSRLAVHLSQQMSTQQKPLVPPASVSSTSYSVGLQQGLCKSVPPQTHMSSASSNQTQELGPRPAPNRKSAPFMPATLPTNTSAISPGRLSMTPGRLTRLQRVMEEHSGKPSDLHTHFGLDWSEDSAAEDDDEEVARVASYQYWRLQARHSEESAQGCSSRSQRVAGLASYLQQKYTHLRREDSALRRHRKSQRVLREALVQAANRDPTETAGFLQTANTKASSTRLSWKQNSKAGLCSGGTKGELCRNGALPFTQHCFQHILSNGSQQLFNSCTARFADGAQCSVPVFDITHQTPLCDEHAKKMDNFLRGDVSRRMYHQQQQQQQQRKPLRKPKAAALTKKHKKKGKRGPRRPQKPIPPALPQGNLGMPSALSVPSQSSSIRSPLTPDLSTDEFPDDIHNDIHDISHELELNQEDFSDVLPRLPDDMQDFDLFEGKTSELLPTSEEADELVRVLQAMGSYPESLACLSGMGDLGHPEGVESRSLPGGVVDLLSSRLSADTFSSLELDPTLLHPTDDGFPPSPLSPQPPLTPPSSVPNSTVLSDGTFIRRHPPHLAADGSSSSSSSSSSGAACHIDLHRLQDPSSVPWSGLPLSLTDAPPFHSLVGSETLLLSTALSTPPAPLPPGPCQPTSPLSALPQSSLTAALNPSDILFISSSSAYTYTSTSPPQDAFFSLASLKHPSPLLLSHCGIPTDLQPYHSSPAPPMDQA
ncbi:INO80 complex subunit D-B isoform X2 [Clupea harengus]|uniref:INO80 complex subunit D-B isoform X2 n=1 Tax=Clupea harengus TaxID=7950 RepID=A0A6P8GV22_CLUHA|nr:INO80 complex subunit D-B isoform X2 [Clupea harengus]